MQERTFVGDPGPGDAGYIPPKQPTSGGTFVALGLAALAIIFAIAAFWVANSADSKAQTAHGRIDGVEEYNKAFAKQTSEKFDTVAVRLAKQVTETNNLNDAVAKLQSKAEQSVVDQLSKELKDKANKYEVRDIASQLLGKADSRTVRKLARRINKFDERLVAVEEKVFPPASDPPPAPAPAPAPAKADPPKPAAAAPAPPVAVPAPPPAAKAPPPPALGPTGKPEAPAKPVVLTK